MEEKLFTDLFNVPNLIKEETYKIERRNVRDMARIVILGDGRKEEIFDSEEEIVEAKYLGYDSARGNHLFVRGDAGNMEYITFYSDLRKRNGVISFNPLSSIITMMHVNYHNLTHKSSSFGFLIHRQLLPTKKVLYQLQRHFRSFRPYEIAKNNSFIYFSIPIHLLPNKVMEGDFLETRLKNTYTINDIERLEPRNRQEFLEMLNKLGVKL